MKKIILLVLISTSCTICYSQTPTRSKTVSARTTEQVNLEKKKTELTKLLNQLNKQLNLAKEMMNTVQAKQQALTDYMKDLESQDKMGNFEMQDLMSKFNQAESTASAILKKASDTNKGIIGRIN